MSKERLSACIWGGLALLAYPPAVFGLVTNAAPEEIPPLEPALPEVPPGFWERHGMLIAVLLFIFLIAVGASIWLLKRKRTIPPEPPATTARQQLSRLRKAPADARLLSTVSNVLKRYLANAFDLPKAEMTTGEFCRALAGQSRLGTELSSRATALLRSWDEQKFSATPPAWTEKPVEQANEMVDLGEARLAQLRRAEQASSKAPVAESRRPRPAS
jgi:hypothetical protein